MNLLFESFFDLLFDAVHPTFDDKKMKKRKPKMLNRILDTSYLIINGGNIISNGGNKPQLYNFLYLFISILCIEDTEGKSVIVATGEGKIC